MVTVRLRTKFLLSMVLISAGLTSLSLLLVRQSMQSEVRQQIISDLQNSVSTFQSFQREQEVTLSYSADLLADLPNLRALMTTNHEATIQDGSTPLCRHGGGALFLLVDRAARLDDFPRTPPRLPRRMPQTALPPSAEH